MGVTRTRHLPVGRPGAELHSLREGHVGLWQHLHQVPGTVYLVQCTWTEILFPRRRAVCCTQQLQGLSPDTPGPPPEEASSQVEGRTGRLPGGRKEVVGRRESEGSSQEEGRNWKEKILEREGTMKGEVVSTLPRPRRLAATLRLFVVAPPKLCTCRGNCLVLIVLHLQGPLSSVYCTAPAWAPVYCIEPVGATVYFTPPSGASVYCTAPAGATVYCTAAVKRRWYLLQAQ